MSIIKNLKEIAKKKINFFTTPSHSQSIPFKSALGKDYYKYDLSEIDGLDNLNSPEGCILDFHEKLKEIYSSGYSHILTNGSTQGMLALMLATLKKGDKALCAVNCHKCVHNGLILTGANPVWIYPHFNSEFGVYTSISTTELEKIIEQNTDAKCLIITNPTYDGVISNIEKISEICRAHDITLIVDEAHGALWNFDKTIGSPAILSGADAAVQSLHKTCGAINPAALVHLSYSSKITKNQLLDALNLISTTSPSFPIMANIEETVNFLSSKKGKKEVCELTQNVMNIISRIKDFEFIKIYYSNNDITKLLIHPTHISAQEVSDILYKKFKIECEVLHKTALTFVCGIGTSQKKFKKLLKALAYINKLSKKREVLYINELTPPEKVTLMAPSKAFKAEYEEILPEDAIGKVCAQMITTYPPGIPILTYGEQITNEHLSFLNSEIKIRIVK